MLFLVGEILLFVGLASILFWKNKKESQSIRNQLQLAQDERDFFELKVKRETENVRILSHELMVKQDFSSLLIQQLKKIKNLPESDLKGIELFVKNELNVKSSRVQVKQVMNEVDDVFYNKLRTNHPNLTQQDISIAALVVMNMSNKEIGISKGLALNSVKVSKFRLKKKLNLRPEDDMTDYLKGLML